MFYSSSTAIPHFTYFWFKDLDFFKFSQIQGITQWTYLDTHPYVFGLVFLYLEWELLGPWIFTFELLRENTKVTLSYPWSSFTNLHSH